MLGKHIQKASEVKTLSGNKDERGESEGGVDGQKIRQRGLDARRMVSRGRGREGPGSPGGGALRG